MSKAEPKPTSEVNLNTKPNKQKNPQPESPLLPYALSPLPSHSNRLYPIIGGPTLTGGTPNLFFPKPWFNLSQPPMAHLS